MLSVVEVYAELCRSTEGVKKAFLKKIHIFSRQLLRRILESLNFIILAQITTTLRIRLLIPDRKKSFDFFHEKLVHLKESFYFCIRFEKQGAGEWK